MDYKHRIPGYNPRPKRRKSRTGLWISLAVAAVVAAGAVAWALLRHGSDADDPKPQEPQAAISQLPAPQPKSSAKPQEVKGGKSDAKGNSKQSPEEKPKTTALPEPRFTFYKILPEKESIIPESEIKNLKHEESLGKKTPAIQYTLQAGSFANVQDAEKLKARLSSLKIKSHIENVKIENATWNRVKIGPFTSLAAADGVRSILRGNQIDSVVQKSLAAPGQPNAGR